MSRKCSHPLLSPSRQHHGATRGSQDPDGIRNIRINRKPGANVVSVLYDQNEVKDLIEIQFETVKTLNGWRISDLRYKMNKSIDPNFDVSLKKVLSGPY